MAQAGISRATLNNYIGLGLLSKPVLRSSDPSGARVLGYFPDDTLQRISRIQNLKRQGWSMTRIAAELLGATPPPPPLEQGTAVATSVPVADPAEVPGTDRVPAIPSVRGVAAAPEVSLLPGRSPTGTGPTLQLSLDEVTHPAYMFSYGFELTWYNDAARREILGDFERLAPGSADRHVLPMVAATCARHPGPSQDDLLRAHVRLVRSRLSKEMLLSTLRGAAIGLQAQVSSLYDECPAEPARMSSVPAAVAIPLERPDPFGRIQRFQMIATYFREGVLVICTPEDALQETLSQFLSRRDLVIRHLLRKRLPVLTPLAVLVADLQGSTRICSELPPEEYFELINDIWARMDPIFRSRGATHGKHVGDGMVYFFFPQPDSHYAFNAVQCAQEMREEMRRISSRWALRKGWFNELHLNTALHEGTEWLGTFQTTTSIEFAVLGDTINQAARLSEFARHGTVWASKSLIGKLSAEERVHIQYGVPRRNMEGREVFIESTFAQVESLTEIGPCDKIKDVAQMPVTEIRALR